MSRVRRFLTPIAAVLAILIGELPSAAGTITQIEEVTPRTTGFSDSTSLTFKKFDVVEFNLEGQRLDSIEFLFSGHIGGGVRLENESSAPRTITTFIGATLTLIRPDNVILLSLSPRANTSDDLSAFDGTMDFLGTSGVIHNNLTADQSGSREIVRPSADLNQFMGPGTFSLLLESTSDSGDNGGGALTAIFNAMASAQVTVIYTHSIVIDPPPLSVIPEPSSFALLGIGGGFTLLYGGWRRHRRGKAA